MRTKIERRKNENLVGKKIEIGDEIASNLCGKMAAEHG